MRNGLLLVLMLFGAAQCFSAEVEGYPSRPVRIIVGYGPGNTTDFVARLLARQLSEQTGKSFVVENRAGATATIGTEFVSKSAPDGYTLLLADANFTTIPGLRKSLPYDPVRDFTPISQVIASPMLLVVRPSLKANTLKELIALAQANAGKLNYGSGGIGGPNHLYGELFNKAAKIDITHIPYSGGSGDAVTGLLGSQVDMMFSPIPTLLANVNNGRLRALGVTTDGKRLPLIPDVPSMAEVGVSGMAVYLLFGLIGPAAMPKDVVNRLNAEVTKAIAVPSVRTQFVAQGAEVVSGSSEAFSGRLREELRRWAEIIKSSGIPLE